MGLSPPSQSRPGTIPANYHHSFPSREWEGAVIQWSNYHSA